MTKDDDAFTINRFSKGIVNVIAPAAFGIIAATFELNFIYILMAIFAILSIGSLLLKNGRRSDNVSF